VTAEWHEQDALDERESAPLFLERRFEVLAGSGERRRDVDRPSRQNCAIRQV
jgi:hypothetical protein